MKFFNMKGLILPCFEVYLVPTMALNPGMYFPTSFL